MFLHISFDEELVTIPKIEVYAAKRTLPNRLMKEAEERGGDVGLRKV
jgi:hypothetical protein